MAFAEPQQDGRYYSKAVIWIGLILIALNMYANGGWSDLWSILTTKNSGSTGGTNANPSSPTSSKTGS